MPIGLVLLLLVGVNLTLASVFAKRISKLNRQLKGYRALNIRQLLVDKRRSDIIAASISEGIFLIQGENIVYVNPVAKRILESDTSGSGRQAVRAAMSHTIPIEFELKMNDRKLYYLFQSYPISDELIEEVEHSVVNDSPLEKSLESWQAKTLVLAQDVTLVHEGQEAKGHFLGTLAHEVKTPITSLILATRMLKKGSHKISDPILQQLIQTCIEETERLRVLLGDLFSVSKFDTLTQKLEIQEVDIGKLIKQSIHYFRLQAKEREIQINVEISPKIYEEKIYVPMDAAKVSWALSNLLINAIHHASKGGKVNVLVSPQEKFVQVKVQDSGPGIEKSRQKKIFEKFSQHYNLRVARSGSTGMGLAIAKEIIVAHGGQIWVRSNLGQGAEFCFTLPLKHGMSGESFKKGEYSGTSAGSG